jgi:hypothetical protein
MSIETEIFLINDSTKPKDIKKFRQNVIEKTNKILNESNEQINIIKSYINNLSLFYKNLKTFNQPIYHVIRENKKEIIIKHKKYVEYTPKKQIMNITLTENDILKHKYKTYLKLLNHLNNEFNIKELKEKLKI